MPDLTNAEKIMTDFKLDEDRAYSIGPRGDQGLSDLEEFPVTGRCQTFKKRCRGSISHSPAFGLRVAGGFPV